MIHHPISVSVKHVWNHQAEKSPTDPGFFPGLASGDASEGCQIAWKAAITGTGHGMPKRQ